MENQELHNQPIAQPTPTVHTEPVTPPIKPKKAFKKWILITIILVLILSLPLGGYLLLGKLGIKPKPATITIQNTKQIPTPNPNANWKTYTNEELGYTLKYPSNIFLTTPTIKNNIQLSTSQTISSPSNDEELKKVGYNIEVTATPTSLDLNGLEVELKNPQLMSRKEFGITPTVIAGQKALSVTMCKLDFVADCIVFVRNGLEFRISVIYYTNNAVINKEAKNNFENILSTFKFTDRNTQADTSNWIDYTSVKGKFTLKYPPTWVQPANKEMCNPGTFDRTLYLGPDADSVMYCATSYGGQMSVASYDGDLRTKEASIEGLINFQSNPVNVSGINGKIIEGTYSGQTGWAAGFNGTKLVRYIFYTNGVTYVANYIQAQSGSNPSKDVLKDFKTLVSTFKFTQ